MYSSEGAIKKHWTLAQAFNLSIGEAEAGRTLEFKDSPVYRVSSRTVSIITQRNPVSEKKKGLKKEKRKKEPLNLLSKI